MFSEDQLLPISALQHFLFCERQCALIHLEQLWAENRFTVEGQHLHKKAHAAGREVRDGVIITRGLRLRSFRLGLYGKADLVEVSLGRRAKSKAAQNHPAEKQPFAETDPPPEQGLAQLAGRTITPVEYKRGKPKANDADRVQLCAQALCLEEMLGVRVESGALFYGKRRRRTQVLFDTALRATTEAVAFRLHEMIDSRRTPPARREPKCDQCSLLNLCMPGAMTVVKSMSGLVDRAFRKHLVAAGPVADQEEASR